jgi:hypothetical protein
MERLSKERCDLTKEMQREEDVNNLRFRELRKHFSTVNLTQNKARLSLTIIVDIGNE